MLGRIDDRPSTSPARRRGPIAFFDGLAALAVVWALGSPTDGLAYDPFQIPRAQFDARVRKIALAPTWVQAEIEEASDLSARIDTRVQEIFRTRSAPRAELVPPSVVEAVWREMSARLGGAYDPRTGAPRPEVFPFVEEHTRREVDLHHGANATMWIRVESRILRAQGSPDGWLAGGERLSWRGQPIPNLYRYLPQRILGYVVRVSIIDVLGRTLYDVEAPIAWHRVYLFQGYEDRNSADRLASDDRIEQALQLVLSPIFDRDRRY
ncbi:MAG: hypothetical protein R3F21_21175 [Myxococcota bacterium]